MHFEVLIEDRSGKKMLEAILPKLLGNYCEPHTWKIHAYNGVGEISKGLTAKTDANKRILLDQLPRILRGYSKNPGIDAVIVVVDVDSRDCKDFLVELQRLANTQSSNLTVLFRLAIEEIEVWYLGDKEAIFAAYPEARHRQERLKRYSQDSICGTWELLADIIYRGGATELKENHTAGSKKYEWAEKITPHMEPQRNLSSSFQKLCEGIQRLTATS